MAKKPKKAGQKPRKKKSIFSSVSVVSCAVLLFIISLPTFVVLIVGLIPSLFAMIADRRPGRNLMLCVFGLNFSGLAPYIVDIWQNSITSVGTALHTIIQPLPIIVIYGAAGLGLILYSFMPPVIASVMNLGAQKRVAELRKRQRDLIRDWGESLTKELENGG